MASVRFYLKEPRKKRSSIFFRLNYGAFKFVNGKKQYLPLQYQIEETIEVEFWSNKKGEAKQNSKFKQYPEFNSRLNHIRDTALTTLRRMQNDGLTINNDTLRKELDLVLKKYKDQTEVDTQLELMAFIRYFISISNRKESTKKAYNLLLNNLEDYEVKYKVQLTFDSIDLDFYNKFVDLLQSKRYTPNTVGGRIKMLKVFMNEAYERNLHSNTNYKKKAFTKPSEETKSIYLNEKELKKIEDLDLSNNTKLDNVRDWFLIGAYTGLRISDLKQLSNGNIRDNVIEIKSSKTQKTVIIPLHPTVVKILEKHNYELPKMISNQKFNDYIKEVAEKAEINENILITETKGIRKEDHLEKKYNLVSAHTARRSFATNAFIAGVPAIQIMKMTGHTTEKVFMGYIKISEEENANKLQNHPFFNKQES